MKLPPIHFLEAFESVARLKSIVSAANELSVTPSAISHRISNLESRLGVYLFDKHAKHTVLTNHGQDYLVAIQDSLAQITSATDLVSKHYQKDIIKIDCCESFGRLWLLPRIKDFLKDYPNVLFQMGKIEASKDQIQKSNFQISRTPIYYDGMVLENLFKENMTPLAAPAMINKLQLKISSDLLKCPLLYTEEQKKWWSIWFDKLKLTSPRLSSMSGVGYAYLALEAAHQQLGIVVESLELSREYLSNKYVAVVFPSLTPVSMPGYYLTYDNHQIQKDYLQEFKKWIFKQVSLDQKNLY